MCIFLKIFYFCGKIKECLLNYLYMLKMRCLWKPMVLCVLGFSILGCSDTKEIVLPPDNSHLGMIGYVGTYAKQGEPFLMACSFRLAEHAKVVKVAWSDGGEAGFVGEDEQGQQVSYKTFVWNEPGEKEVVCHVSYSYGDEMKEIKQAMKVYTVPPVWGNCYWGDSILKVKNLHPNMELEDEHFPMADYIERISSMKYNFITFGNGGLFAIKEVEEKSEVESDVYHSLMEWVKNDGDGDIQIISFRCGIIDRDITDEDRDFVWSIDDTTLSDADIERLNKLLHDGFISFIMKVEHDYIACSYKMEYKISKSEEVFSFIKKYSQY